MDAFDVLGLPRQPWIEPAAVRAAFQARARALHPDAASGDVEAFARLNAAHQELLVVSRRLRLLAGDVAPPAVPRDPDLAFEVGGIVQAVDAELAAASPTTNPLLAALAQSRRRALGDRLACMLARVDARRAAAETRARSVASDDAVGLAELAGEFSFLERWDEQLRRRDLELRLATG